MALPTCNKELKHKITWAPVLLQPSLGSGERLAIALMARSSEGEDEVLPLLSASAVKNFFPDDARYIKDVVALTIDSCRRHLKSGGQPGEWRPPLEGLYLGETQRVPADLECSAFLRMAAPFASFAWRDPLGGNRTPAPKSKKQPLEARIRELVIGAHAGFEGNFNASLPLGCQEARAEFTFLSPVFAANIVSLEARRLKQGLQSCRARLWALHLLTDAPSYLFRPKIRELITGVESEEDSVPDALLEVAATLKEEAERRDISVVQISSPTEGAQHILERAQAA